MNEEFFVQIKLILGIQAFPDKMGGISCQLSVKISRIYLLVVSWISGFSSVKLQAFFQFSVFLGQSVVSKKKLSLMFLIQNPAIRNYRTNPRDLGTTLPPASNTTSGLPPLNQNGGLIHFQKIQKTNVFILFVNNIWYKWGFLSLIGSPMMVSLSLFVQNCLT